MIVLAQDERRRVLAAVERLLDEHPDLAGRGEIPLPYVTRAFRVRLL
ncbi:MAG: hypothetical protein M3Q27_05600 [Actinomycetota bacterium]|nr:hypothetical protein [Actinomycetota bacterium]